MSDGAAPAADPRPPSGAAPEAVGQAPPVAAGAPVPVDRGEPVLVARDLTRSFQMGQTRVEVLRGVTLSLHGGESVAIMGRSGAGKSTLLHVLGLLDRPDGGSLLIGGRESRTLSRRARSRLRNQQVGFVFQFYHLIPELDALSNALLPAMIRLGPLRWLTQRGAERRRARELLEELGLGDRLFHRPSQLSGGERQRVAIARALISGPSVLLCDEPTGNLDERTSEVIAPLLFELAGRHGHTLVMVTHDAELATRADRVLHLHDGVLETAAP